MGESCYAWVGVSGCEKCGKYSRISQINWWQRKGNHSQKSQVWSTLEMIMCLGVILRCPASSSPKKLDSQLLHTQWILSKSIIPGLLMFLLTNPNVCHQIQSLLCSLPQCPPGCDVCCNLPYNYNTREVTVHHWLAQTGTPGQSSHNKAVWKKTWTLHVDENYHKMGILWPFDEASRCWQS